MLPILINYKVIHHTLTNWEIIISMIIPKHITYSSTCLSVDTDDKHRIDNDRNNTVGGGCYSAYQAVSKFAEHNIDMVSWVYRKCQTRTGVSGDVYKTLECVTKTDSKFFNRVLVWMTSKSTSINGVTKWLEQLDFCLNRCKWELADKHIPNSICFMNCFLISLSSRQSAVMTCPMNKYCFRCIVCNVMRSSICATYITSNSVWRAVTVAQVTPYHPYNSVNLPRHLPHSTLHLLLGGDGSGHLYMYCCPQGLQEVGFSGYCTLRKGLCQADRVSNFFSTVQFW